MQRFFFFFFVVVVVVVVVVSSSSSSSFSSRLLLSLPTSSAAGALAGGVGTTLAKPGPRSGEVVVHIRLCTAPYHSYAYYDLSNYFKHVIPRALRAAAAERQRSECERASDLFLFIYFFVFLFFLQLSLFYLSMHSIMHFHLWIRNGFLLVELDDWTGHLSRWLTNLLTNC